MLARNEQLDTFSHTVAHDLKGPLSNIIGFIGWLQGQPDLPRAEGQEYINIIARNAVKMDGIIDELLLLAQVRKEQVEMAPINMTRPVTEAHERLTFMIAEAGARLWPMGGRSMGQLSQQRDQVWPRLPRRAAHRTGF